DVAGGVAGVRGGGALLVTGLRRVTQRGFGQDLTELVESPFLADGAPARADRRARLLALATGRVGVACGEPFGPGFGGRGGRAPRHVAGGGLEFAAVAVVGGLAAGHAGEGLPVGDRDTFVVLDRSAVDAAEVAVLGQGPLVRCGTGAHLACRPGTCSHSAWRVPRRCC